MCERRGDVSVSYFLQHKQKNLWHGKFSLFPENLAVHAISTRQAGASGKPYDSLNLAFHVGDDAEAVRKNRVIFANSLGLKAEDIVSPQQVHGSKVARVTEEHRGMGAMTYETALEGTDALITDEPGLPLLLCFADSTPALFLDPEHGAVGGSFREGGGAASRRMEGNHGKNCPKDVGSHGKGVRHRSGGVPCRYRTIHRALLL